MFPHGHPTIDEMREMWWEVEQAECAAKEARARYEALNARLSAAGMAYRHAQGLAPDTAVDIFAGLKAEAGE